MRYLKTYDNFKPIKINNQKPYRIKKNVDKSIRYLQKGIKSLRKRLENDDNINNPNKIKKDNRSKMNKDKNDKIQKLKDLSFRQQKQGEYLRNHPIKENLENSKNLIEILESEDFNPENISIYMGLKENEYVIDNSYDYQLHRYVPDYDINGVTFYMKLNKLEDIMDIESGTIEHVFSWASSYSNYEYYVEDDELSYLNSYLSDEVLQNIKKLANIFDYEIDPDKKEEIYDFFNYLGLKNELRDFKYEISLANEIAIQKVANNIIKELPFGLEEDHKDNFDIKITIDYDTIVKYMKENNIEAKNIKEFLGNVENEFSNEIEYGESKYEYLEYDDLIKEVDNVVERYLSSPDDIFIKLIEIDNLELFKKKVELANFEYVYDVHINYNRERFNLFELAKKYNKKIFEWLKSEEFEKIINDRSQDELESYRDFMYKEDVESFNL